jgi:hypothetical protein
MYKVPTSVKMDHIIPDLFEPPVQQTFLQNLSNMEKEGEYIYYPPRKRRRLDSDTE